MPLCSPCARIRQTGSTAPYPPRAPPAKLRPAPPRTAAAQQKGTRYDKTPETGRVAPGRGRNDLQWLCDWLAALYKTAASGVFGPRQCHRGRLHHPVPALVGAGSGRSSLPVQRAAFSVSGHAAADRAAVCADSAPAGLAAGGSGAGASGSSDGKAAAAGTAILTSCAGRTASGRTAAGSACCWRRSCWQFRRAGTCGAAGCI